LLRNPLNGTDKASCCTPSSSVIVETTAQCLGALQTSIVKFDGKRGHAEHGKSGLMYSCCNVDGKCDTNSGLVLKSISFEDGTLNQVSDFGSCSRRFLVDNTG